MISGQKENSNTYIVNKNKVNIKSDKINVAL